MGNRWLWSSFDPPTPHRIFGLKLIKISRPVNPLSQFEKFSTFLRAGIDSGVDNCAPTGRKDIALGTETIITLIKLCPNHIAILAAVLVLGLMEEVPLAFAELRALGL